MSASCTFCSATAVFVPTDECRVCATCAQRIARLAAQGLDQVWDAPRLARDDEMEELAQRVAEQISPTDSDSHYNLAVAYRAMGLHADALREAAVAVDGAAGDAKATAALRLLLTEPLLRKDGVAKLRAHLVRIAKN